MEGLKKLKNRPFKFAEIVLESRLQELLDRSVIHRTLHVSSSSKTQTAYLMFSFVVLHVQCKLCLRDKYSRLLKRSTG